MIDTYQFADGVISMTNALINERNPVNNNSIGMRRVSVSELQQVYHTGLGQRIITIKAGRALRDTLQFEIDGNYEIYNRKLYAKVKEAAAYMLGFGRGILVVFKFGDDLSTPLKSTLDINTTNISCFSGDMVTVLGNVTDLNDPRYMQPELYSVRGVSIHPSRVVDFTYVKPVEDWLSEWNYGGISEFELIYDQMVNDGIVERSLPIALEKNSIPTIRVDQFKQLAATKKEGDLLRYFQAMERAASIFGARLIDKTDEITIATQNMTNLDKVSSATLQRLCMVSGIPQPILLGESVRGLNSSGRTEQLSLQSTLETLQENFLLSPINQLMAIFGLGEVEFKDNQSIDPNDRIEFETKVIDNAIKIKGLGRDYNAYLENYGMKYDETEPQDLDNRGRDRTAGFR